MTPMQIPTVNPNKPTTLAELVALVESNNDQFAVRYESSYFTRVKNSDKVSRAWNCTLTTARFLLSCSWGKYQIMGENLFNMGLSKSVIAYCADTIYQDSMFTNYCIINKCNYSLDDILNDETKRLDFALKYNGSGDPTGYANKLINIFNV